jgi:hypothetical protein
LFDLVAAAVWAGDLSFFTIDECQDPREGFLAGAAEKLIVRHACLLIVAGPNRMVDPGGWMIQTL